MSNNSAYSVPSTTPDTTDGSLEVQSSKFSFSSNYFNPT